MRDKLRGKGDKDQMLEQIMLKGRKWEGKREHNEYGEDKENLNNNVVRRSKQIMQMTKEEIESCRNYKVENNVMP